MNKISIIKVIPYLILVGYSFVSNLVLNNGAVYREYVYLISKVEKNYFALTQRVFYIVVIMAFVYFIYRQFKKKNDYTYLISIPFLIYITVHLLMFRTYTVDLDYVLKGVYLLIVLLIDISITLIYFLIRKRIERTFKI